MGITSFREQRWQAEQAAKLEALVTANGFDNNILLPNRSDHNRHPLDSTAIKNVLLLFEENELVPKGYYENHLREFAETSGLSITDMDDLLFVLAESDASSTFPELFSTQGLRLENILFVSWDETEDEDLYRSLIEDFSRISLGTFAPRGLVVAHDTKANEINIQFRQNGKKYNWKIDHIGKWLHDQILDRLGQIVLETKQGKIAMISGDGPDLCVVVVQKNAIEPLRDLGFKPLMGDESTKSLESRIS